MCDLIPRKRGEFKWITGGEGVLGDGKAIGKGVEAGLKVGDIGNPAGQQLELRLGSTTRSWRALKVT